LCRKPRVVLLDFDGTVIDTMHEYAEKAAHLIAEATGLPLEEAHKLYMETAGRAFREQLRLVGVPEGLVEALAREFETYKKGLLARARLDPLVVERIEKLRRAGLRVYLSTNNECEVVGSNRELTAHFDGVLCYDKERGLFKGRPHVELVKRVEGVEPGEIVFIGDSDYDIQLYEGLGVRTVRTRGLWLPGDRAVDTVLGLAGGCED